MSHGPFGPSVDAGRNFRGNTQKIDCRLQGRTGKFSLVQYDPAHTALTKPAPDSTKEVIAVININVNFSQHADLGMPVSGRVRVASLRAFPTTTCPCPSLLARSAPSWTRPR